MPAKLSKTLKSKLRKVRLLLCDVDGVLTDGGIFVAKGVETKRFFVRDGLGLRILIRAGIKVGWISNRPSPSTTERATELGIDFLYQSAGSKVAAAEVILKKAKVSWEEVCYIGDDIVDITVIRRAGVGIAVADAVDEVRACADHVTQHNGGHGAVREIVEAILDAQGKWAAELAAHSHGTLDAPTAPTM